MRHKFIRLFVSLFLFTVLLACSLLPIPSTPPYYGAFLKKGNVFVEMGEYRGAPPSSYAQHIPTTSESQPLIVLWRPDVNLALLVLTDETRGTEISYNATPGDDMALEIRPEEPLDLGLYCLEEGSPGLPASRTLHWCLYCDRDLTLEELEQYVVRQIALQGSRATVTYHFPEVAVSGRLRLSIDLVPGWTATVFAFDPQNTPDSLCQEEPDDAYEQWSTGGVLVERDNSDEGENHIQVWFSCGSLSHLAHALQEEGIPAQHTELDGNPALEWSEETSVRVLGVVVRDNLFYFFDWWVLEDENEAMELEQMVRSVRFW